MRILLINPPHESIGSRMPGEILPPLGLLAIGGPLIDDGHDVRLLDADIDNLPTHVIVAYALNHASEAILIGHNGSTSAHPRIVEIVRQLRTAGIRAPVVYGGVYPTYHWREALDDIPGVDVIVRGEGEETVRRLMRALEKSTPLDAIAGLAYRGPDGPTATPPATMITDLDAYRVGFELIDHGRYSYYGGLRGVVVQFSRGCPHLCSYCGQRGFWTKWRHRDPVRFAKDIARLHREHGVQLINFADENPTTSKKTWRAFLEALIAENCPDLTMIATIRADDIVRDADILHLYRKAGFARLLIGIEHTDELTLAKIRKGGAIRTDRQAITLLRAHGILSLVSYVVGFEEETERDYWRAFRQIITYDPDQIITLYVTPHRWTPFFRDAKDRRVIQTDQRRWDYKHQVLANRHIAPWRTFLWIKLLEVTVQARPRALYRTYLNRDRRARHGMRWYSRVGRRVWLHEIWSFLWRDRHVTDGPTLADFWQAKGEMAEEALSPARRQAVTQRVAPASASGVSP
jgi:anaerobic magnesium-protoporphyrin IX monomethyl ester cyclase